MTDRSRDVVKATGAWITTRDGREMIDLSNSKGSILLGHGDPDVVDRVCDTVRSGLAGQRIEALIESASRRILERVPQYDGVAFFKTGTAAVRGAASAMWAITGKPLLVSAGYHGWDPIWAWPETAFTLNEHSVFDCFYVPWALEEFLAEHADRTACAVLATDLVNLRPETFARLFEICRAHGVPVVADEVKFGLRLAPGLSFQDLGLEAEVAILSKGLANGFPLACVAGDEEVVARCRTYRSTLTYEAVALAACDTCLEKLERVDAPANLAREGGRFLDAARELFQGSGLPVRTEGRGAIFQFIFGDGFAAPFHRACAEAGLALYEGDNQTPSWAFRDEAVDAAIEKLSTAVERLVEAHPERVGAEIADRDWWRAAFDQMDGFCDGTADRDAVHAFVAEQVAAG